MFENPRRSRQARNFTTNVPKILDLKSSSEQIFSENCRWVPLAFGFPNPSLWWFIQCIALPHVKTNGVCCFTEDSLDFSSFTADYTKLFYSKIQIFIFFFFKENFLWSKQFSRLLTVNQSAVNVSVRTTGNYKRRETRRKTHSALAFDVNTRNKSSVCRSVLQISVYHPTLQLIKLF